MRVTDEQLKVFGESVQINGAQLVITRQLDRKDYLSVNKILEALGGKWNRGLKAHLFDADPTELIEQAMLTRNVTIAKDELGYFPTPKALADRMAAWVMDGIVERRGLGPKYILEPSAGTGALVRAIMREQQPHPIYVTAVEIDQQRKHTLHDAGAYRVIIGDFLDQPAFSQEYDGVIMNPPFGNQKELAHVYRAASLLAPRGRLAAVMPNSVVFRTNTKTVEFREWVASHNGTIEPLPEGSFKESGTMVHTVLVTLEWPS